MRRRVLAVASGGGHWQQLMMVAPALDGHDVLWLTTMEGLPEAFGASPAAIVSDCNRHAPLRALRCCGQIGRHMMRHRPEVVISTGALPGFIAVVLGKALRARTLWIDSVANAEAMSMSGRLARRVSDLWLSQWPEVARREGAEHAGSVL